MFASSLKVMIVAVIFIRSATQNKFAIALAAYATLAIANRKRQTRSAG
jgi:hypothetical protein